MIDCGYPGVRVFVVDVDKIAAEKFGGHQMCASDWTRPLPRVETRPDETLATLGQTESLDHTLRVPKTKLTWNGTCHVR